MKSEECKTFYSFFFLSCRFFRQTHLYSALLHIINSWRTLRKIYSTIKWKKKKKKKKWHKQHLKTTTNCLLDNIFTLRKMSSYLAQRMDDSFPRFCFSWSVGVITMSPESSFISFPFPRAIDLNTSFRFADSAYRSRHSWHSKGIFSSFEILLNKFKFMQLNFYRQRNYSIHTENARRYFWAPNDSIWWQPNAADSCTKCVFQFSVISVAACQPRAFHENRQRRKEKRQH